MPHASPLAPPIRPQVTNRRPPPRHSDGPWGALTWPKGRRAAGRLRRLPSPAGFHRLVREARAASPPAGGLTHARTPTHSGPAGARTPRRSRAGPQSRGWWDRASRARRWEAGPSPPAPGDTRPPAPLPATSSSAVPAASGPA